MASSSDESRPGEHRVARRGILFRLSAAEHPERRISPVESIVENLRSVLNSDRGIAPSCPELGLSLHRTLSDWDVRRSSILEDVGALVERYEPRLTNVKVSALSQASTFRFSVLIEGELPDGDSLQLKTNMTACGAAVIEQIVQEI